MFDNRFQRRLKKRRHSPFNPDLDTNYTSCKRSRLNPSSDAFDVNRKGQKRRVNFENSLNNFSNSKDRYESFKKRRIDQTSSIFNNEPTNCTDIVLFKSPDRKSKEKHSSTDNGDYQELVRTKLNFDNYQFPLMLQDRTRPPLSSALVIYNPSTARKHISSSEESMEVE